MGRLTVSSIELQKKKRIWFLVINGLSCGWLFIELQKEV